MINLNRINYVTRRIDEYMNIRMNKKTITGNKTLKPTQDKIKYSRNEGNNIYINVTQKMNE